MVSEALQDKLGLLFEPVQIFILFPRVLCGRDEQQAVCKTGDVGENGHLPASKSGLSCLLRIHREISKFSRFVFAVLSDEQTQLPQVPSPVQSHQA